MDGNINENIKKEIKERRKYLFSLVSVLTLVVAIIGATYAYFQLTATNDNINGKAAKMELDLAIEKIAPMNNNGNTEIDGLTPLIDENINTAVNIECSDGNNKICQVYEMVLTNNGTATINVWGTIKFEFKDENDNITENTMPNLKFSNGTLIKETDGTISSANFNSMTSASFDSEGNPVVEPIAISDNAVTLAPDETETIYLAVWISEKEELQYDKGKYIATVTYSSTNADGSETQGVTSTIRE